MIRRFAAIWRGCDPVLSLVLLAGVSAVVLFARDLPWRGEWGWTLDWAAGATILSGPVTAGLAAYQSARWRSVTAELLLPTARRRLAACFAPAVVVLAAATGTYVAGTAALLAVSAAYHPTDRFVPVAWLVGLAKLGLCAAVGWWVGSRFRAYVAASVAVAGCYVVTIVAGDSSVLGFWLVGGSTGPATGKVVDVRYTSGATLLFLGLSAGLAALYLAHWGRTRRMARVTAGLSLVTVGLGLLLSSAPGASYDRVDAHPHRLCRAAPVTVCLLAGNTSQLRSWSVLMNEAVGRLRDVGLAFPARYEQPTPAGQPSAVGVVFFDPGTINIRAPGHLLVAESLATPASCPAYAAEQPPIHALNAREWLARLILHRAWPDDTSGADPRVAAWVRRTSDAEQDRWARLTFDGLRACALSEVDAPDD